jgi:hypothetical protein
MQHELGVSEKDTGKKNEKKDCCQKKDLAPDTTRGTACPPAKKEIE